MNLSAPIKSDDVARMPGSVESVSYRRQLISSHKLELPLGDARYPAEFSRWFIMPPAEVPKFCPDTGDLLLRDECIGKFQVRNNPTDFELVLGAFQEAGWPREIATPLGIDPHDVYGIANRLNKRIRGISFHTKLGGKKVQWRPKGQVKLKQSSSQHQ